MATGLDEAFARIGGLFARSESRGRAADYVHGLLSGISRKNSWQMAAHAGHASPDGIQWLLTRAPWSADALRDLTRDYVLEILGDDRAVLVLDEIAFPKRGDKSVGVARQPVGSTGRIENCQLAVFMAYVAARGVVLIDRELYLPRREWADDPARRARAGVPEDIRFATKSELAARMLARAVRARVPFGPVVAGQSCSGSALRAYGATHGLTVVEEISARHHLLYNGQNRPLAVDAIARLIPTPAAERDYPASGAAATVRLGSAAANGYVTSLMVRTPSTPNTGQSFFLCHAPKAVVMGPLVTAADTIAVTRSYVADSRVEAGLDHYEVRKWKPWYRHISLSQFAMAYLAVQRADAGAARIAASSWSAGAHVVVQPP